MAPPPIAVLLLPAALEGFARGEQARDLLRAPGVVAVEPARAGARLPAFQAARLVRALPGRPAVVVVFHPAQWPFARALMERVPRCELWYGRSERWEAGRLAAYDAEAAGAAALTFAASEPLAGGVPDAVLVPDAADAFPAPTLGDTTVAIVLGDRGAETDWGLLRTASQRLGDRLVLLVAGDVRAEAEGDEHLGALRAAPNVVWLGARSHGEAARLVLCADVAVLPLRADDATLPVAILQAARAGRRTIVPGAPGVRTWERAVHVADGGVAFTEAIASFAGARAAPDAELRGWALGLTAERLNAPLWARLRALGVVEDQLLGRDRP